MDEYSDVSAVLGHIAVSTRGVATAMCPCGVILIINELYGAESCRQIANVYLEVYQHYKGMIFLKIKKYSQ